MPDIRIVAPAPSQAPPNFFDQFEGAPVVDRIVGAESGGDNNAKNPNSSATGAGQFLDSTWLDMITKHRPEFAHLPKDQLLALRSNEALSKDMVGKYADENSKLLEQAGFAPTPGNIYLAHFAGPQGAIKILQADPNLPIGAVLGEKVIAANPFLKDMTAGDTAAWASKKMGATGNFFDQFDAPKSSASTAPRTEPGMVTDEQVAQNLLNQQNDPNRIVDRGSILPIGRNAAGDVVPALPGMIEGPRQTTADIMAGKPASQVTGKEALDLGALLAGGSAASGLGKGIARAGAVKQTEKTATEAFGPVATPPMPPVPAPVPVKTAEGLKAASQGFYKQAEDAGVVFKPAATQQFVRNTIAAVRDAGFDKDLHGRAGRAIQRLFDASGSPLSFNELEILRRVTNAAGKTTDRDEGRIVGIIKDKFDDFIAGLTPKDVMKGDPRVISEVMPKARELWSRAARLDKIGVMVDRATTTAPKLTQSGIENALRQEFRALARNPRELRAFSAEEQAAIKKVARGTTGGNVARGVGGLAPNTPFASTISGTIGASIGGLIGGPVGAAVGVGTVFAAGAVAKNLARRMTEKNIKALETLIASGGSSQMAKEAIAKGNSVLKELGGRAAQAGTAQQ